MAEEGDLAAVTHPIATRPICSTLWKKHGLSDTINRRKKIKRTNEIKLMK